MTKHINLNLQKRSLSKTEAISLVNELQALGDNVEVTIFGDLE